MLLMHGASNEFHRFCSLVAQWQKMLGFERKCSTRNCWFMHLTSLISMGIVNKHCLYHNVRKGAY